MAKPPHSAFKALKPQSQALALEQRILFDGAAVAAADQFDDNAAQHQSAEQTEEHGQIQPEAIAPPATGSAPRHLLVIDSRVEDYEQLTEQLPDGVQALIVSADQDGLAQITDMLQQLQDVDSIQILSHGSAGQFTLGSTTLSRANIADFADTLSSWAGQLSEQADILLYGCRVGASDSGRTLVAELAHWTGADVAASDDDTGAAAAGGDWELETRVGDIDQPTALDALALAGYEGLLANAEPTVTLDSDGRNVLLGDQFSFTVNLTNPSSQEGYAPFIDLFIPATGKDGDDGVEFISARYFGQTLSSHTVTFDENGLASHPLAVDAEGEAVVINAADYGMQAGDKLVVLEVPFASITSGQPIIPIEVTASLSNLADTSFSNGSPELTIQARAGFQYGNDSLNNPSQDPSLIETTTQSFVVLPTVITFDQTISTPEGETASGPNYGRSLTITTNPAPGQTLTNVSITQPLPDNIQVTAITPGDGGVLTSITLVDGRVISSPSAIALAIANDNIFISEFTVVYASMNGSTDTVVNFYVPESDASGQPIIDAQTGDDVTITIGAPTGSGEWIPVDPRDVTEPDTGIDFSGTGFETSFVAKSITLNKNVSLQTDIGSSGLTPGDTLSYTLNLAISDYFAFGRTTFEAGEFTVADQMSDGQTLSGTPTLSFTRNGVSETIELVYSSQTNADGTTSMMFDIGQSLSNAFPVVSWLNGDLAFDDEQQGATTAVISYLAVIGQSYTPPAGAPHSEINESDSFGNSATVTATLLQDRFNLTGYDEADASSTSSRIPTSTLGIDLVDVNGSTPPPNGELRPGDEVTFRLSYDLLTGDYENFDLTAYLPLPLFDISGISWSQGDGNNQWTFGDGNTNPGQPVSVTTGAGNSIVFDFGDYVNSGVDGSRIEVEFTITVGDQPFADNRSFNVLAQSSQVTTLDGKSLLSSADTAIISSVAEPLLAMSHGVVSASNGTVTGTSGNWNAPGSGGAPFSGNITDLSAIDGDVTDVDAGDLLRLATAIENTGGGGAYDVTASVTLPNGLNFVGGSLDAANLQVTRGDGTSLTEGVDYSVSGNQITFLDANFAASLQAGRDGTEADNNGSNMVIITYDVVVAEGIDASRTLQSSADVSNYASVDGGSDFTGVDLSDEANQQIAAPEISKNFADGSLDDSDSSASHTTGSNLVIGESMLYDIVVTLPEGNTQGLVIEDLIPAGMRLDTDYNGGQGYQLITSSSGSGALNADFGGIITVSSFAGSGGNLGDDGVNAQFTFSAASVNNDNDTSNNSFVIRLQLVASNVIANQANQSLQNNAQLRYQDLDDDTPNGDDNIERTLGLIGGQPTVTLREPTLIVEQQTQFTSSRGVDQGDVVEYVITLRNNAADSDFDAFDLSFLDDLPTELSNLTLDGVSYNNATNNGGADFELIGNQLRSVDGANIDISKGGSIEIRVSGVVNDSAASQASFDNIATVQWSSLNDAGGNQSAADERTGLDGPLNSGVLNDYRSSSTISVPVLQAVVISRVGGLDDTAAPNPTNSDNENVAIGEIIRYRVSGLLAEGSTSDYNLQITLDQGLSFLNDGTARVVFISDNGISTDVTDLITAGVLNITGSEGSDEAQPIQPDLSGNSPGGVLNGAQISVSTDGNGRTVLNFNLGTLINSDSDDDFEGVSVEFNVQVENSAANIAGTSLTATAVDRSGSDNLSAEKSLRETIVEPSFNGLNKQIIDFDANPAGSSGSATVSVSFTQNGGSPAFDVNLSDSLPTASNYQLLSIKIDGVSYNADSLPAGVTAATNGALSVDFEQLDSGSTVTLIYQVDLPNQDAIASTDATLTWSSLPEDFTDWGGSNVGTDGDSNGERTGSEVGPNTYVLREGAGLGIIRGTLWDDSFSADGSTTPDGPGLAGQTVNLTWAGLDGNLDTTDDNLTFSTTTDANGQYQFGILPAGIYRLDTPADTISYPQPLGDLRVRIDTDGGALGQIQVTLGEGSTSNADAGYVQQNDAPVNSLPGTQNGLEDVPFALDPLSITDVDAGNGNLQITLSVLHGTLSLDPGASLPGNLQITGNGSATLILGGTVDDLNAALAALIYQGNLNYNGEDTLTMVTSDLGNFGDANGNGIPGESGDALIDQDSLLIELEAVNDDPIANDDAAEAVEAGGTNNAAAGINPRGNLLNNDTDVDIATNDDVLRLVSVSSGGNSVTVPATGTTTLTGLYGDLVVDASGNYQYLVHNDDPEVQALLAAQSLSEQFSYQISDIEGATASAVLNITLRGANDTPVGVDDEGTATEAGGVANGSGGSDATGNVLNNDTDVDSTANGESKSVTGVRTQIELTPGPPSAVNAGTTSDNGTVIQGSYGTLTIGADGSYRYVVDNSNPAVERMVAGDQLTDTFNYQVTDAGGLNDLATLRIVIEGANDNPVASDDAASAQAASSNSAGEESNPSGNVITLPSRPGNITDPGGNGVDQDVDRLDQPNTQLTLTGIVNAREADVSLDLGLLNAVAAGTDFATGTLITGQYGSLRIGADGSYFYDVDSTNPDVIALPVGETLTDTFTYQITDTAGLTDLAQLVVTVRGANDIPDAGPVAIISTEAGGINNTTPGNDPSGTVLNRATDPDGDPLSVIRVTNSDGVSGTIGSSFAGRYGSITLNADGTFTYQLDNSNPEVEALRQVTDRLQERFVYAISDGKGGSASAELVILIRGQNDAPVAADDSATAVEAGGSNNNQPGVNPVGNVLSNDTDVDGGEVANDPVDYGETKTVSSVRTGSESASGTEGALGTELRGDYGWLTLNADGSYSYRLDNSMAEVQALRGAGDTLTDSFSYTVADTDGAEDRASLNITIQGANDAPVANNDSATAVEAGGVNNGTAGVNPTGNLLSNDSDVDGYGESLSVILVQQSGSAAAADVPLFARYGTLTVNADGTYSYVVDNSNAAVQALRTSNDRLTETFTYIIRDLAGATSSAQLTITIVGANDAPVAVNDTATAVEAGGTANATPGSNPSGNLLTSDTDVDASDSKTLNGLRSGAETAAGSFTEVNGSITLDGLYGSITVGADGSYNYQLNNDSAAVQALKPGDVLQEVFTYRLRDTAGATDSAQLTININGAWDTPVANDNVAFAAAANGSNNGLNPAGNVLTNDSDVDAGDQLSVSGARAGSEAAGGALQSVNPGTNGSNGTLLNGQYGQLIIGSDGTYEYILDNSHPDVLALTPLQTLQEQFTYAATDLGGLRDEAQLTIIIRGRNDAPIAVDNSATAVEAGGVANTDSGLNPSGNVLTNDRDPDGDELRVASIRNAGGTSGTVGTALQGLYGQLTLNADGTWTYLVDNDNPEVEALRLNGQTLTDDFTYTLADIWGATDTAQLRITIEGRNDAPVAVDDTGTAVEAGGTSNGSVGSNATGNVLDNDNDVDGGENPSDPVDYGETKAVTSVRTGTEAGSGAAGTLGSALVGQYGSLTLNADGSYSYVVDENNAAVQALRQSGDTLSESFSYELTDAAGLSDHATLTVTIEGANDSPVATDDVGIAVEAGGTTNGTPGSNATGNVLDNDTDVDANGETKNVSALRTGNEAGTGTAGTVGSALVGEYGSLTLNADGSYTYVIDNDNPDVQALRQSGITLTDSFTYTVRDALGATDLATLTITVTGANDAPVALDDTGTAVEAGGTANGTAGSDATGNVLDNDTDVDAYGETKAVASVRTGSEAETGTAGALGSALTGTYGSLTLNADGSYTYMIDNDNAAVQALRTSGDTLTESFSYEVVDANGLTDRATLTITLTGANDAPVANNNFGYAAADDGSGNAVNPAGNLLTNDTDVDASDSLNVTAARTGAEAAGGTLTDLGAGSITLIGQHGELIINADGSYSYTLDTSDAAVIALRPGQLLQDRFTYAATDAEGLSDLAQLTIVIRGRNDAPQATDDNAIAVEAGGVGNATSGIDPTGNVLLNDSDLDGDTLSVSAIRSGTETGSGNNGTLGTELRGQYGWLTINADGSASYRVDNDMAEVEALRLSGQTLVDSFTYALADVWGATDQAQINVTIQGSNDAPVASDDAGTAVEAGGENNATPGSNATGNVLTNDTDVDSVANGETKNVSSVRTGAEADSGVSGTIGSALTGTYGSLTLNADGSYTYVIDNDNPEVQALRTRGETLSESFSYEVIDANGLTDRATLTITLEGANDAPEAANNLAYAAADNGAGNSVNPTGNLLTNDSDIDASDVLAVSGARTGAEAAGGALSPLIAGSLSLTGQYGQLVINADGSYTYTLDTSNPDVIALGATAILRDQFTYAATDLGGLSDQAQLTVIIRGRNDAPVGVDDTAAAVEAGGTGNAQAGVDPSGNVLDNDTDADGNLLQVSAVRSGAEADSGTAGTLGTELRGQYGWLTINADGSYSYRIDNDMAEVQALRVTGQSLTDDFTYTLADIWGATDTAQLSISIDGRNDAPVAVDDTGTAVEAGGTNNATAGSDATGNVLTNDTDVDSAANGETKTVASVRTGAEGETGTAGSLGSALTGTYGSLTLNADGSYTYVIDNSNPEVQALRLASDTLTETFTYSVIDAAGLQDSATLTITVRGANDAPLAADNLAYAAADNGAGNAVNPAGNLLTNDSDIDNGDALSVSAGRTGSEAAGGDLTDLAGGSLTLTGQYGSLLINADGSYRYTVDTSNPDVIALGALDTLQDQFTYAATDLGGLSDEAQLTIIIRGRNDAPVGVDDSATAVEAGGIANADSGSNASGNVLDNDTDEDSNPLDVTAVRSGTESGTGTDGALGSELRGQYGWLTINADGTYDYRIDNDMAEVQALRISGQTLTDSFTYTLADVWGATDLAQLDITIDGRNDAPVATDDTGTAVEAGGSANATPGSDATGNVLNNDTDVDSTANGETKTVSSVRTGSEQDSGTSGIVGSALTGTYGSLTLNSDGSYTYAVDNDNAAVQALRLSSDTLTESFTYSVIDAEGLEDTATLTITVRGANDAPEAANNLNYATADNGSGNAVNPRGNVLNNDSDIDAGDRLSVGGARTGALAAGGSLDSVTAGTDGSNGTILTGQYGQLVIGADGSYQYIVDVTNADIIALGALDTLQDQFTYAATDLGGLSDEAQLTIIIRGRNDAPVGNDDSAIAVEAGGVANGSAGVDPSGNVLDNDTDDDSNPLEVTGVYSGTDASTGVEGILGSELRGQYGWLTLNADGTYDYRVDNDMAEVQALRLSGQTLTDDFTYRLADVWGAADSAVLSVTIEGANDAPVAVDDTGTAVEAGGNANGSAGSNATGNVLSNDTDVDSIANGEGKAVNTVRTGNEGSSGTAGTVGSALVGTYGSLTLNSDGSYTYVVDNSNPAVQALRLAGQTLSESFTYSVIDAAGLSDTATLTITVRGANDAPVAVNDTGTAIEAGGTANGTAGSNANGNVLANDTDVDSAANGETKTVSAIRTGEESSGGTSGTLGIALDGQYGSLTLNADGSYSYVIDNDNPAVQALRQSGDTLTETFTYTVRDARGATDQATLTISVRGANDAPVAVDDSGSAVEAGGIANGTAGSDASGNVLANDTDIDAYGETQAVASVRTGSEAGTGTAGTLGSALAGSYGSLTLNADGSYTYVIDNDNAAVQALRTSGDTLTESFSYEVIDANGLTDRATLTITLTGANDAPVASNNLGYAAADNGNGNVVNPSGNLLTNDRDVDAGDSLSVSGARIGNEAAGGALDALTGGSITLTGQYGELIINADGSYSYNLDTANPDVIALGALNVLQDQFTYAATDLGGLSDEAQLTIIIRGRNDAPVGNDDNATAVEAGGVANGSAGIDPSGNVLDNDTDEDSNPLEVTGVRTGAEAATGTDGTLGSELRGQYGWLTLNADGTYDYRVDNDMAEVQALRLAGQILTDSFTYTLADFWGATDTAQLSITIEGRNDAPVAADDSATAVEAGGIANSVAGNNATGNVLTNDTDVDSVANGESKTVSSVRTGTEAGSGTAGTLGSALVGQYGSLTLNADGSYSYVVDENNAAVQALRQRGDTLSESFSYELTDAAGLTDRATLTITIEGANDAPIAVDDTATAAEAGGTANGTAGSDATGNVLNNDTDVDGYGETKTVSAVRTGAEAGSGTSGTLGTALAGQYGSLTLNADGSYTYVIDNDNPDVQALRQSGNTLTDSFTYTVRDALGATDLATLTITVTGANDAPVAVDDTGTAVEAGGTANGTPGSDATGNVLDNDTDVDAYGETKAVASVRTGSEAETGTAGTLGSALAGQYGSLTLAADGSYRYVIDNDNAAVQALSTSADTLTESFSYEVIDANGLTDRATLTITLTGANDVPVAVDDNAIAVEAGGVNNGTPGFLPQGNVLDNDTDIDSNDQLSVVGIRTGSESGSGTTGQLGTELRGMYGWLTIRADGTTNYRLDDDMAEVQALRSANETLSESFTYTISDLAGLQDSATLNITIRGANDAPVAANSLAYSTPDNGNGNAINPAGNVLTNDSDVDGGDSLSVSGARTGNEAAGGALQGLSAGSITLIGAHGTLVLNADGSYQYTLDVNDTAVINLGPAEVLLDQFTYAASDLAGLNDEAQLSIVIRGRNDAPQGADDSATAVEAGGLGNAQAGFDPAGNVLANDQDLEGDELTVTAIRNGTEAGSGTGGSLGSELRGQYGWLTINADGSTRYRLDNDMAEVQALRQTGQTLVDSFTYTLADIWGATDQAQINITIDGRNDAPVAVDDSATAVEAGGTANGTAGSDATGNVLTNDTDLDSVANGETKTVTAVRTGAEAASGSTGTVGSVLTGLYGSLTLNADGSYTYVVDNDNAAVQALRTSGQTLSESFTYQLSDAAGLSDSATLTIAIEGANDAPVAVDDSATAVEAGGVTNGTAGSDASGNVLDNDTDVDSAANGESKTVAGLRTGAEAAGGTSGTVGSALVGLYGSLTLNADGSYSYLVDNDNAAVQALRTSGQTLTDSFTYTLTDAAGATDTAQLDIRIQGSNDAPVGVDDDVVAVEAGGSSNSGAGVDPVGNVLDNDLDVDSAANGEVLSVTGFSNQQGQSALPGQTLQGRYGTLTLNADGSYQYLLNNDDPQVDALRNAGQTLRESFDYSLRDAAGLSSSAILNILIQGSNDNPVAQNDSNSATDQDAAPQSSGNVLDNDSDVDDGDSLQVVGIRAGTETGNGTSGVVGQPLYGRYGTLVIHADGSYTYSIDMSNPEVLQTAGQGPLLNDVFTYTTGDLAGGTDQAELVITLDISAPYIEPAGPHQDAGFDPADSFDVPLGVDPAVFISPVLERNNQLERLTFGRVPGGDQRLGMQSFNQSRSIGAGLGDIQGQFVRQAVRDSQMDRELDMAWLFGRQGRISLSADGLLDDPGLYSDNREPLASLQQDTDESSRTASSFRAQMLAAAQRLHSSPPTSRSGG
ncbi:VCBS domain-containing protein [Pseudomonas abyssi]|uniref:VCBS domain-containing protein n=1 Tax=Pseudomonas abyssi TaxID=170540 RepID=UPI003C7C9AA7